MQYDENPFASHEVYTTLTIQCDVATVAPLQLHFEEEALSVCAFEKEKGAYWQVDVLLPGEVQSVDLSPFTGIRSSALAPLEMRDWVTENQKDFPPLEIGSFYIHGSHLPPKSGVISLEIDAGRAFGTGEHATTAGCILAMETLLAKSVQPSTLADIGCGTGILALCAQHLWPKATILASDMDAPSVETAIENAQKNQQTGITFLTAAGVDHPQLQAAQPYDLLVANILAGPLIELAQDFTHAVKPGGFIILSGLLTRQEEEVIAAYTAQGAKVTDRLRRDEWSALTLETAHG